MNKVILMGRLTADPDYRQTPNGISVCRFTVAISRTFVSKDSGQRETDFINVTAWRNTADFVARYFTKGKPILVEGSLRNDNYTDQNGVKHYSMRVQADTVNFCLTDNNPNAGSYNNGNNYGYGNYQQGGYGNNGGYQGNYGNGGYSQNAYAQQGGNGYYQQPQQQPAYQQPMNNTPDNNSNPMPTPNGDNPTNNDNLQVGSLDDFEEILSDGEIPF